MFHKEEKERQVKIMMINKTEASDKEGLTKNREVRTFITIRMDR